MTSTSTAPRASGDWCGRLSSARASAASVPAWHFEPTVTAPSCWWTTAWGVHQCGSAASYADLRVSVRRSWSSMRRRQRRPRRSAGSHRTAEMACSRARSSSRSGGRPLSRTTVSSCSWICPTVERSCARADSTSPGGCAPDGLDGRSGSQTAPAARRSSGVIRRSSSPGPPTATRRPACDSKTVARPRSVHHRLRRERPWGRPAERSPPGSTWTRRCAAAAPARKSAPWGDAAPICWRCRLTGSRFPGSMGRCMSPTRPPARCRPGRCPTMSCRSAGWTEPDGGQMNAPTTSLPRACWSGRQ